MRAGPPPIPILSTSIGPHRATTTTIAVRKKRVEQQRLREIGEQEEKRLEKDAEAQAKRIKPLIDGMTRSIATLLSEENFTRKSATETTAEEIKAVTEQ